MTDLYGPKRKIYRCIRCGHLDYSDGICPACHKGILVRCHKKPRLGPKILCP